MTGSLRTHYILVSAKSAGLLATRLVSSLNRWTSHCSVTAEHAAVTRLRPKDRVAVFALIQPLASIGGHDFSPAVSTLRTGQHRRQEHFGQGLTPVTVDGKPASLVARVRASNETWVSS